MTQKVVRVYLTPQLAQILEDQSETTGLSESEIVRAAYTDDLYKKGIVRIKHQTAITCTS
jgi:hypothetical protein